MKDIIRRVDRCRVCGMNDWFDVISLGPMPLANDFRAPTEAAEAVPRYPLDVIVCRGCRLMCLRHVVDPNELFKNYVYTSSDSLTVRTHTRHLTELCIRRFGLRPGSFVVELGSNTGTQLDLFRAAGMRVLGVDPARNLADIAGRRGIETLPEFFGGDVARRVRQDYGAARLVLGRHVFAHIADLDDVLDGVKTLLDPSGVFAIEVPYLLDLLTGNQFDTIYHEHLSYFSVGTLCILFHRHGLRVVDVERAGVHGGSIVVFARPANGDGPVAPRVADLLALEGRTRLTDLSTYHAFARRVRRARESLGELVRERVTGGSVVAGDGAPAKGAIMVNACHLGGDHLAFCHDTTPFKQGRLLPGTTIPVWSPERARRRPPDYYLLLAWNYAEEILRRETRYLHGGGRFIIPLPEPRIVSADSGKAVCS
ncbi:class I SAM-dependent methyltransferase [Actinoallomurus acanthiterrae]